MSSHSSTHSTLHSRDSATERTPIELMKSRSMGFLQLHSEDPVILDDPPTTNQSMHSSVEHDDYHISTYVFDQAGEHNITTEPDAALGEHVTGNKNSEVMNDSLLHILNQAEKIEWKTLNFFLRTLLMDMEAFDLAREAKQEKAFKACMLHTFSSSGGYPLKIKKVSELGPTSLYVEWSVFEQQGIDAIIIKVDGIVAKKFFSGNGCKTVLCDINVQRMHLITMTAIPKNEQNDFTEEICKSLLGCCSHIQAEEGKGKCENNDAYTPTVDSKFWKDSTYMYVPQKRRIIIV